MSDTTSFDLSRRTFLRGAGALGAGALLLDRPAPAQDAQQALPRRVLGRTNEEISALSLGTWPSGRSRTVGIPDLEALVNEALDLGVNYIDAARAYGKAEEGIGKALGNRRDQILLASKVMADDAEGARESFEESLRLLRTDHVDFLYLHSMGDRDPKRIMAADGALTYLLKQKETGKARFLGISGHSRPHKFVPVVESGMIDVVLMAMNFVDRYTYGFEEKVLPAARKHNVGVACMKVFGGLRGGFAVADGPNPGPEMSTRLLEQAVRYSLGLPGVSTLVIGCHTVEQLRQNVQMVKNFEPLTEEEQASLANLGRRLAPQWGPHYGPVA